MAKRHGCIYGNKGTGFPLFVDNSHASHATGKKTSLQPLRDSRIPSDIS